MTISIAIQAHPSRRASAKALARHLGAEIAWSKSPGDVWDTHRRARLLCDPAATWNLVVQDDAILGHHFLPRLEQLLAERADHPILSLFCRRKSVRRGYGPFNEAARAGLRAGGFTWPRLHSAVAAVVEARLVPAMLRYCDQLTEIPSNRDDERISQWALEHGLTVWYPLPSLVSHRQSGHSLAGNGPNAGRGARWFE